MHVDAIVYFDSGGIQCMWRLTELGFVECSDSFSFYGFYFLICLLCPLQLLNVKNPRKATVSTRLDIST